MTETQMLNTAFHSTVSFLVVAALKIEGKYSGASKFRNSVSS